MCERKCLILSQFSFASTIKAQITIPLTYTVQDPGLQSFLKVKVTLILREVILLHDDEHLIMIFRSGFVFNRLSSLKDIINQTDLSK